MKNKIISISNLTGCQEEKKKQKSLATRSFDFFRSRFLLIYLTGIDLLHILYK